MALRKHIINLGILAHVDAGKTSITELLLHKSGLTKIPGSVDKGTSHTDWLPVEKERGISVRCASVSVKWNGCTVNIIDTPGHIDFSSEVDRAMAAMDCALLVVSAVEGVQAHTETLWQAIRHLHIPCMIFINKIDRVGAHTEGVITEIQQTLTRQVLVMQRACQQGSSGVYIESLLHDDSIENMEEAFTESIIGNDEALLDRYLKGSRIPLSEMKQSLAAQIQNMQAFPVLMGSAKYGVGVEELLERITDFLPAAQGDDAKPLSGVVYKVEHDKLLGKLASIRLFDGTLKNRDQLYISSQEKSEKVSQIKRLQGQRFEDIEAVYAGETAAVFGLSSVKAGDMIGLTHTRNKIPQLATSLLTVKVLPLNNEDYAALVSAMQMLSDEDPNMDLIWLKDQRELHIKIIGLIQVEILGSILEDRFHIKVVFEKPTVIYKETPLKAAEAYEEYTMPKPCWAIVLFNIEPGSPGSGVQYESKVGVNKIAARYQQEIERTIPLALRQGMLGWEVTDIKITLVDGAHHNIHSRAGDFAVATPMAIMNGLKKAGTQLLEPLLDFSITAPEEYLGKIASSLTKLRATFGNQEITDEKCILSGSMPVISSLDYGATLNAISGGKAILKTKFSAYSPCPLEMGATAAIRGISPLDRAKYILKARKALH